MKETITNVLDEVLIERQRQDSKWGEQNHNAFTWLTILGEEVGECSRAALDAFYHNNDWPHLKLELIQVAAVAVAIVESLERNELKITK